jgi:WD40 repeat protein
MLPWHGPYGTKLCWHGFKWSAVPDCSRRVEFKARRRTGKRGLVHGPQMESGACLHTLEGHSAVVTGVAPTPDGKRAVSASWDKTLKVWDLESGLPVARFRCDAAVRCCACAVAYRIVAGDERGRVHSLFVPGSALRAGHQLHGALSPVRSGANRGAPSTLLVQNVGRSQPLELSVFSVDAFAFVDSPVERGRPDWTLSNPREYLLTGIAARRFRGHQTAGRPPSGNRCGCRTFRAGKRNVAMARNTGAPR